MSANSITGRWSPAGKWLDVYGDRKSWSDGKYGTRTQNTTHGS